MVLPEIQLLGGLCCAHSQPFLSRLQVDMSVPSSGRTLSRAVAGIIDVSNVSCIAIPPGLTDGYS